jgi:hypothetical protein
MESSNLRYIAINLSDETIDRVIKGLKVRATTRPATPTQWFDVSILFASSLWKTAYLFCTPNFVNLLPPF